MIMIIGIINIIFYNLGILPVDWGGQHWPLQSFFVEESQLLGKIKMGK